MLKESVFGWDILLSHTGTHRPPSHGVKVTKLGRKKKKTLSSATVTAFVSRVTMAQGCRRGEGLLQLSVIV
jgi:hypothetical protein